MNAEEKLINSIASISGCNKEQLEIILPFTKKVHFNKGDYYLQTGEIPKTFAFVIEGLFAYFYINDKGNQFVKGFFPENTFLSSYSALIEKRRSYFSIQALEDSYIITIDFEKWKLIAYENKCLLKFLVKSIERGYSIKEARERELLILNAEERYNSFLEIYQGLENRLKQHYIASYLGISPVSLSRIKNEMKKR